MKLRKHDAIRKMLDDISFFVTLGTGIRLRSYQEQPARSIIESVTLNQGLSFVVMFPRQSGKNELQAHIEGYLLTAYSNKGAEIVKVSPTWKPQTYNAMRRLEKVLAANLVTSKLWTKERDYIYCIDRARIYFLSGSPEAHIVGATASLLLEVDEAQDIQPAKYDKDIAPMAASTNATRVFWGTAWSSQTLLHRELVSAKEQESRDGRKRVFVLTADQVASEVPQYGIFVAEQVAKFGRLNPMIKSQYYSEEVDAETGMFPALRLALMQGDNRLAPDSHGGPKAGGLYAMLVDLAGEDESIKNDEASTLANPGRDSTALTLVEVDTATLRDPLINAPTYRVRSRKLWTGVKHTKLYGEIKALADLWRVRFLAIDATGVGAGLASFLDKALPGKVISFIFNSVSKSKLGWGFLAIVDSGRWKEGVGPGDGLQESLQNEFYRQLTFCQYEITPGPDKKMKWGVQDGTRDPANGELVHDDLVLSAALVALLDEKAWPVRGPAVVVNAKDPLAEMDRGKF